MTNGLNSETQDRTGLPSLLTIPRLSLHLTRQRSIDSYSEWIVGALTILAPVVLCSCRTLAIHTIPCVRSGSKHSRKNDTLWQLTKAIGVQYSHGGQIKVANAQKEIIVSTGALQSPKLLELSGVGNTNILRQHNIEVVKDHPGVGENLQDHLVCDISFAAEDKMETLDALARQEPKAVEEAMLNFMQKHERILTSAGIMTYAYLPVIDFLTDAGRETLVKMIDENRPSGSSTPEDPRAQMYYQVAEKTLLDRNRPSAAYLTAIRQNPVAPDPTTGKSASPQPGKHLIIATVLAQPLSRGTVHITSNNPAEVPKIDPKYLSNPLDVEIFAKHILYIESIANSAPLSGVLRQSLQPSSPLAHITDLNAAKRYMQSRTISMWHPAGTCAMLPEQIGGVVDNHLRVYGVGNLRVVDSSIVPLLPRC